MQAEKITIEIPLLTQEIVDIINQNAIISYSYKNAQTSISGGSVLTLSKSALIKYKDALFNFFTTNQYPEIQINITLQNEKWLLMNGIVLMINTHVSDNTDELIIQISHKTKIIQIQQILPFNISNDSTLNSNGVIDRFIQQNKFNLLYDYKIPLSKLSKIDSSLYSQNNQYAYDYLTTLLNDCGARLFTEVYRGSMGKDKTVLYFYDTAQLLSKYSTINNCNFTNNNVFNIEYTIDYTKYIDKIIINSDDSMDGTIGVYKTVSKQDIPSIVKSIIGVNKNISIPDIMYVKKIKSTSNEIDASQYASALIKESINDGFVLSIKTNSIFTDILRPELGTFKLGMTALVNQSDLLTNLLKVNFQRYIDATENYFVIASIEYEYDGGNISCVLNLVPNDIIQL